MICARRHIHMSAVDAKRLGVQDHRRQSRCASTAGRDLIFSDVTVRVAPDSSSNCISIRTKRMPPDVKKGDVASCCYGLMKVMKAMKLMKVSFLKRSSLHHLHHLYHLHHTLACITRWGASLLPRPLPDLRHILAVARMYSRCSTSLSRMRWRRCAVRALSPGTKSSTASTR